ncbi:cell division protein FtsK [Lentzea flaviverrucosa]|uniref:DNA segregation ATPase FtsK/SpoIIIE, S-DNA-T family n=1 Tax=Lentzea flaviverrucosa TaxID=200379 RepID=A0A1H9XNK1_9PSEU|nr:cell division protein FtsK [Lentzea flaviverrucosa]RDI19661.1 S-DNA-T family DNA segregation ATPase FtsK/SpoIIIE [Lentzea flaviverrucosa]SES47740.1 DNA segregation ATPase FtsK/SpoIIIE, S-DNA-T family [Lentzea flaviverrucosa]
MSEPMPTDDAMGKLVPFPGPVPEPVTSGPAAEVEPAGPVLDAELITDEEYRRSKARQLAESAVSRLPAQWQTRESARQAGAELAGRAVLAPVQFPAAVGRGLAVSARAWWQWVRVADFYDASKAAEKLADRWQEIAVIRRRRGVITVVASSATALGGLITELTAGSLPLLVTGGAVSTALAVAGRRKDGAGGRSTQLGSRSLAWLMNGDHLVVAFRDAKLIGKDERLMLVKAPRHDGTGWALTIDLPPSRKASDVISKRESLASALAVDEVRLIVERVRGDDGHAGRLALWVGDADPYAAAPIASPLGTAASWDLWNPVPFGTTARGTDVRLPVVWTSLLIGAIPRQGKTFVARLPLTAAALDPHVRIIIADGKGGKDFRPFEQVAHRFIRGARESDARRLIRVLEECAADVADRFDRLSEMDDELCPESKVTPEITRDPAHGMPLTVVGIDEVQNFLGMDVPLDEDEPKGKKIGTRICELLTYIAKTGPAAGYSLILATQKPDAKVIPDGLRGQLGTRFALKVMTYQASETILGAGTYKAGMDASRLLTSHKGVGLLLGADGETELDAGTATTVRTHLLHIREIRQACERGRALREQAGTLTGDAAGQRELSEMDAGMAARLADEVVTTGGENGPVDAEMVELPEVLGLLVEVIEDEEHGVIATEELAGRIGWTAKALGEALRRAGVPAPSTPRQRVGGSVHAISVTDLDAIRAAVVELNDGH